VNHSSPKESDKLTVFERVTFVFRIAEKNSSFPVKKTGLIQSILYFCFVLD